MENDTPHDLPDTLARLLDLLAEEPDPELATLAGLMAHTSPLTASAMTELAAARRDTRAPWAAGHYHASLQLLRHLEHLIERHDGWQDPSEQLPQGQELGIADLEALRNACAVRRADAAEDGRLEAIAHRIDAALAAARGRREAERRRVVRPPRAPSRPPSPRLIESAMVARQMAQVLNLYALLITRLSQPHAEEADTPADDPTEPPYREM